MPGQLSGERLREIREDRDMSREMLAIKVARSAQTIALWERGVGARQSEYIIAIAEALGVEPRELKLVPRRRAVKKAS